ncbi:MAG: von Willebrand factor type A domain-containing protein [Verrucomicrobia bacterium]|nr:von Willebrand factor type A domain-containing protein [Verrucomicrobiota bacterium]
MNKNDDLNDRFMEELLREDARGRGADEKLLAAVDAAMGEEEEDGKVTPMRRERSRAPYAWAAALTVSAAGVLGYMGWRTSEERVDLAIMEQPEPAAERVLPPSVTEDIRYQGDGPGTKNEGMTSSIPRRPSAPSSAMAKAIASREPTDESVPVPAPSIASDAADFGDRDDFGDGWGGGSGGGGNGGGGSTFFGSKAGESQRGLGGEDLLTNDGRDGFGLQVREFKKVGSMRGAQGVWVSEVAPGSLAGQMNLHQYDVILSVDGVQVSTAGEFYANLFAVAAVKPAELLLKRGSSDAKVMFPRLNAPPTDRERYGQLIDQPWKTPQLAKFSTFSVDVDTASYTNIRRMLQQGVPISPDAVRIEECINYFDYQYPAPTKGGPFAVSVDVATCPWAADHHLVKIGLKGMEVPEHQRPTSNLVFLIDVSGSMQESAKLPLLVDAMKVLVEELDERDRVSMVVYAGAEGVVLKPTRITEEGRGQLLASLDKLRSGGSTNGGAGITRAYQLAQENFVEGGVNRVILATDGDFNVGTTGQGDLATLVKERAQKGVFLSVLGFGSGNINDAMLEAITNDGNGNYFYIDSQKESRKVFLNDLSGTLVTIAKDVKIQVDFNPGKVAAYRLIGYANRILRDEDFNNDKVDAGDIGAGHTVTALYEIVPVGAPLPEMGGVDASKYEAPVAKPGVQSPEWLTVKLRYKRPDGDKSTLLEVPVAEAPVAWEKANGDFQFAAGVALFGMKLRQSEYANDAGWDLVRTLAKMGSARDLHGYRAEFLTLVERAAGQEQPRVTPMPVEGIEAPPAE